MGPRLISNQSKNPLRIYGTNLPEGVKAVISGSTRRVLDTVRVDESELYALIPEDLVPKSAPAQSVFEVGLLHGKKVLPGRAQLTVVNDTGFFVPTRLYLAEDQKALFVISPNTDELLVVDLNTKKIDRVHTGDRPIALAQTKRQVFIAHEIDSSVWVFDRQDLKKKPSPAGDSAGRPRHCPRRQPAADRQQGIGCRDLWES